MNTVVTGWKPFSNPRMFAGYGRQKGWERDTSGNELPGNEGGFVELSEEECRQLELPKEWIARQGRSVAGMVAGFVAAKLLVLI